MPTPSNLATRLSRFVMAALESGCAIAANPHVATSLGGQYHLVSWQCPESPDLSNLSMEDPRTYLFFLERSHYSLVCADGSIVQMSFKIHRGDLVGHRLCYMPCPVAFDPMELIEDALYDVVQRNLVSGKLDLVRYRGAVRFDFDQNAAGIGHPASHLTFNFDDVRIPVGRTLDANTFLDFVDRNFIAANSNLVRMALPIGSDPTVDVLAIGDRERPHIAWHPVGLR